MSDYSCVSLSPCYSPAVITDVEEVVKKVVGKFGFHYLGDMDDLKQEGIRIALETVLYQGITDRGYLYRAVRTELGNYIAKGLAACTLKGGWHMARHYAPMGDVDKIDLAGPDTADACILLEEALKQKTRWNIEFRRALDRVLVTMPEDEREIAERLHGLGGLPEETPAEIARELGVTPLSIYRVADKFKRKVRGSTGFMLLNDKMEVSDL